MVFKLAVFLLLPYALSAAEKPIGQWVPVAPAGLTDVQDMAAQDGFLFIAGDSGVFRTGDFGRTWKRMHPIETCELAVQGTRIFAGGRKAMYRSADFGATWRIISEEVKRVDAGEFLNFKSFAFEGRYLFAGAQGEGIFRSGDFGETWLRVDNGLENPFVVSLVGTGKRLLAGTPWQVYTSTDLGKRWVRMESPKVTFMDFAQHRGLTYAASFENGMYRSADHGKTWKSADNGMDFEAAYDLLEFQGTLYVATSAGVLGLSDAEKKWFPVGTGIPEGGAFGLAASGPNLFISSEGERIYCLGPTCPAL